MRQFYYALNQTIDMIKEIFGEKFNHILLKLTSQAVEHTELHSKFNKLHAHMNN